MATYISHMCRTSSVLNFRNLAQIQQLQCKQPIIKHHPATSLLQSARLHSTTNDVNNEVEESPLYPGEIEEPADKLYHGELVEGQERPHMLHAVWRIRSLCGKPWWDVETMEVLGLEKRDKCVIHKNTAAVNELLTQVRHLVRIKPVVLKYGLPNGDYENTLLKLNGEFIVKRKVEGMRVISEASELGCEGQEQKTANDSDSRTSPE